MKKICLTLIFLMSLATYAGQYCSVNENSIVCFQIAQPSCPVDSNDISECLGMDLYYAGCGALAQTCPTTQWATHCYWRYFQPCEGEIPAFRCEMLYPSELCGWHPEIRYCNNKTQSVCTTVDD